MEKEKIIKDAAYRIGIDFCEHLLLESSINMVSTIVQYNGAKLESYQDKDLLDIIDSDINKRIADLLIAIDLVCCHNRRINVRAELQKHLVRLDVQNLSSQLP